MVLGERIPGNVSFIFLDTGIEEEYVKLTVRSTCDYQVVLGIPHRAMYLSERNFKNAKDFHPERWLDANRSTHFANDRRDYFHPFSYGPRNCIGMK